MDIFQAVVIAIIEGFTEFLPISSTGHMAVTSSIMGIEKDAFTKLFEIVIQFGAILSVLVVYRKKFFDFRRPSFYIKLILAIIPALIFGALFKNSIASILERPLIIALVMLGGGILLLFVDKWFDHPTTGQEEQVTTRQAFNIGMYQVLAILLPGLSRSAATIIGGMQQKLTRTEAAEFSFFLAVPTMLAATVKSLYDVYQKTPEVLNTSSISTLLLGSVIAFIIALLTIRFLIGWLQKHGFRAFGWYRIALSCLLLVLIASGYLHT